MKVNLITLYIRIPRKRIKSTDNRFQENKLILQVYKDIAVFINEGIHKNFLIC